MLVKGLKRRANPKESLRKANRVVSQSRKALDKARSVLHHAHGRKAKRAARRALRKAEARYNVATKQLKMVRRQRAVKVAYNKLTQVTKYGSRRDRQKARRKLNQLNNAKQAIAKLRRHHGSKRSHRALHRANVKLVKMQDSIIK